jgi:hypothetical protein
MEFHRWNKREVQSIGSPKDNLDRILVDPLLKIVHNRGIAEGARTGRELMEISWFMPISVSLCACLLPPVVARAT